MLSTYLASFLRNFAANLIIDLFTLLLNYSLADVVVQGLALLVVDSLTLLLVDGLALVVVNSIALGVINSFRKSLLDQVAVHLWHSVTLLLMLKLAVPPGHSVVLCMALGNTICTTFFSVFRLHHRLLHSFANVVGDIIALLLCDIIVDSRVLVFAFLVVNSLALPFCLILHKGNVDILTLHGGR